MQGTCFLIIALANCRLILKIIFTGSFPSKFYVYLYEDFFYLSLSVLLHYLVKLEI